MSRETRIEEIRAKICEYAPLCDRGRGDIVDFCASCYAYRSAEILVDEDYRKQSDVAREIFAEFQSILFSIVYLGGDGEYHTRRMSPSEVTSLVDKCCGILEKYTEEQT